MKRALMCLAFSIAFIVVAYSQSQYTVDDAWKDANIEKLNDKSVVAQKRSEWFRNAKLGMFIHWNQSSVVAAEISWSKQFYDDNGENLKSNPRPTLVDSKMQEHTNWISWFKPGVPKEVYDNLYKSFYPGMFNADSIVNTAKNAGVKYIVMVTKHHDGFCMWNTKYTDYNIMNTPFKRDIVGEMAEACHKSGIKFCIYYSQRDWHHPDYSSKTLHKYNEFMRDQIKELLTKYAPVSGIFFDASEWNKDPEIWEPEKMFKEIYSIQPDIIINNRCGVYGDYYTPEQKIGKMDLETSWEACMTFTGEWSWRGFGNEVISIDKCFEYLISCVGGNGNLLLNVDPLPTGQIDPREKNRLGIIGEWLKKNAEAIYGTTGGPFVPAGWGTSTRKGKEIFLLVNRWNDFPNYIPPMDFKIKSISINGNEIDFKTTKNGTNILIPSWMRDDNVTVIKISTDRDISNIKLSNI